MQPVAGAPGLCPSNQGDVYGVHVSLAPAGTLANNGTNLQGQITRVQTFYCPRTGKGKLGKKKKRRKKSSLQRLLVLDNSELLGI